MSWSSEGGWGSGNSDAEREFQRNKAQLDRDLEEHFGKVAATANTVVIVLVVLLVLLVIVVAGTTLYCWKKKRVTPGVVIRPPPSQGPPGSNTYSALSMA